MWEVLSQVVVTCCFVGLVVVLFRSRVDYVSYSVIFMSVAVATTVLVHRETVTFDDFVLAVEWRVVLFLICLFVIVEILGEKRFFEEIASRIVVKYYDNTRKMFWILCLTATFCAALIEDLSIALIFIPIVVSVCRKLMINPTPFMMGISICINLASTLTPFGSAENILIAEEFNLGFGWFLVTLVPYFLVTVFVTLLLLDRFVLQKMKDKWAPKCVPLPEQVDDPMKGDSISRRDFRKNAITLAVFIGLLICVPDLLVAAVVGVLLFVFVNRDHDGKQRRVVLSRYLSKIDYKLIYFFVCLFLLVFCMEVNGTLDLLEGALYHLAEHDIFVLSIIVLVTTSLLSGFIDNVPVTILFIPILSHLVNEVALPLNPLIVAFILGINLGGNFLPQGAACDMATLELAQKYGVEELNYHRMAKVGGFFALLHVMLGILYLAVLIY